MSRDLTAYAERMKPKMEPMPEIPGRKLKKPETAYETINRTRITTATKIAIRKYEPVNFTFRFPNTFSPMKSANARTIIVIARRIY